jgi:cation transporter-like permease
MAVDDANERLDPGTARVERRLGRGLLVGVGTGAIVGAVIGAIAGATLGSGGATKFWTFFIAAFVACSALGALIGSYSSLESPQPGHEPTDTARPVRDADGLTTEERPPRTPAPPTD